MAQPTIKDEIFTMNNLDAIFSNFTQATIPIEQIDNEKKLNNKISQDFDFKINNFDIPTNEDYSTTELLDQMEFNDLHLLSPDYDLTQIINDIQSSEEFTRSDSTLDEISVLLSDGPDEPRSVEPNDVADSIASTDEQLAMIKSEGSALPVVRSSAEKLPVQNISDQSISLSNSVAVTVLTPHRLQLTHQLEDTFRARYKSDYFPQKGEPRRPRYVADNKGNHYITLQLPAGYNRDLTNQYIRVALITTAIGNLGHFYSPYKFQTNHRDNKVPDENPIYLRVLSHQGNDSSLKLQLVLIKSKLDQLNHAQPLKPFSDVIESITNIFIEPKVSPKELISKYQLDKSHIAFTLCTKISGNKYQIHSETTVISSVISESSTKQTTTTAAAAAAATTTTTTTTIVKNKSKVNTAKPGRQISCPNCAHCFEIPDEKLEETGKKRKSIAKASSINPKSTINVQTNKKTKTTE